MPRKLTPEQRKVLNNRRRALRKLTGDHVDLRKPMTIREQRQLSRHRRTVDQLVQGLVKIAKPRSKKSAAKLAGQGLRRIKGRRFIVANNNSYRAYLDSIDWARDYRGSGAYPDGRVPYIDENGKLKYAKATGNRWAALQMWQNVVNPNNQYYEILHKRRASDL
jgi:hypothetical protein